MSIEDFIKLKTKDDIAMLLQIDIKSINILLSKRGKNASYVSFVIPKKNGGNRLIDAPQGHLLSLLTKLSRILTIIYEDRSQKNRVSYGFRQKKSIKDNAKVHYKNDWLVSLDLENFFPSIHYKRIYGLFRTGLGLGTEASRILALLTTFNGVLPQGSPCSPVLSNMICKKLDKDLYYYAKSNRIFISRYADDISLSTKSEMRFSQIYKDNELDNKLIEIIESNGFKINYKKVHSSQKGDKKMVTGLVINEKINVQRDYVRELRAGLNNISKLTEEEKKTRFLEFRGKIEFIRFIKQSIDPIFIKYANQFNRIYGNVYFDTSYETSIDYIRNRVVLLGIDVKYDVRIMKNGENGSGFYVKIDNMYFIITCYHVVEKAINDAQNFRTELLK